MILACPDCGTALVFRDLTNGTVVCECPRAECRADFMSHGETREEAADKLVQRCEQYGFTAALERKLQALVDSQPAAADPAEQQGDMFA